MKMHTRVVNCRAQEFDVYIGRSGHGHEGTFGNPFRRGPNDLPGFTLSKFEAYFLKRVEEDPEFRRRVLALKGKRLGCFCSKNSQICHGQIIINWLDGPPPPKVEQLEFFK
jgi:hypothetical protein